MKRLLPLLLLAPALALAQQFELSLAVLFSPPPSLVLVSSANPQYVWSAYPVTVFFTVTGFTDQPTCQSYDPTPDIAGSTFDGLGLTYQILSSQCLAISTTPPAGGGGGLPQPPPSSMPSNAQRPNVGNINRANAR